MKQSHRAAEGGANWTWGWKQSVEQTERKGGSLWASKKQLATRAVKSDERRQDRQEMKDQEAEEWGSIQQTHREARIYRTGSRVEQNQVSHSAQQSGIVCHTKNIIYRSRKSQHVGLHVLSVQKLNTTHLGQQNYQWTAPIQFHMSINFTVILKLYILIIIIILMRKYYTLVQDGRQEGVGAGNQEVSALLPAFETDITIDFLPNSRKIIIFSHLLLLSLPVTLWKSQMFFMYCWLVLRLFTYFLLTLSYCYSPLLPLQLPCLLQQSRTQICMYTFGCFLDSTVAWTSL